MIAALFAGSAFAADSVDSCGLGWEVTQDKTMVGTTIRGTTNSVVSPTFGMTSGTMGCDKHDFAAQDIDRANYAVTNFETLKIEMASGRGETLEGFARVMGVENVKAFGELTQKHYQHIYLRSDTSAVEMYKNVKMLVNSKGV